MHLSKTPSSGNQWCPALKTEVLPKWCASPAKGCGKRGCPFTVTLLLSIPMISRCLPCCTKDSKARATCCWSVLYSMPSVAISAFCPRIRRLQTQSSNFAQFVCSSQQTQYMLSPLTSAHNKKFVTMHQNVCLQALVKNWHGEATPRQNPPRLQNLSIVFSSTSGSIQRTAHCLSQFPTHASLLCHGVLVWQSDVDVANCVYVEVGSTHVSGGNQESVINSKHVFLARNTEEDSQSFQRRCCREDQFDSFMAHLRTHQTRTVTWGFGATFVGIDPLEANWFASCSRPWFRFSGVLVQLQVPEILYFLRTGIFDLTWVQRSALDIVLGFPLLLKFFVRIQRKSIQLWKKWAMLRLVLRRSST